MYDPKFLNELAREIAKRLLSELQTGRSVSVHGGNIPSNGSGGGNESKRGNGAASVRVSPRLLTVAEAAILLGRSKSAVEHLIFRREIPVVRHGRSVRLDIADLQKWLEGDKV